MNKSDIELFYPKTKAHWRKWLEKNHLSKVAVWLKFYKKHTGQPTISWSDAVDEALCFGWIDSKAVTIDEDTFKQYFCKRKPGSTWSKINKKKIEELSAKGLIAEAGYKVIEVAKQNGTWSILDEVEDLVMPANLVKALKKDKQANAYYVSLSTSKQKILLQWIALAKTEATKEKRILEIVENCKQKQMPKAFRPPTKENNK